MSRRPPARPARRLGRWAVLSAVALAATACGASPVSAPADGPTAPASSLATVATASVGATTDPSTSPQVSATTGPGPSQPASTLPQSQAPDEGTGKAHGDVPDNAVFLRFKGGTPAFSIQYVEGWQVTPQVDGVIVRDKDSSETVTIVPLQDVPAYVATTDLPALQAMTGFKLDKQDTVKVGPTSYVHLVFHRASPPDPVTGKQVPSTVDRYYVPGPGGLAVVSLSTPDGVDNVDAFRQMIESFRWS